jgi:hypothetical protein
MSLPPATSLVDAGVQPDRSALVSADVVEQQVVLFPLYIHLTPGFVPLVARIAEVGPCSNRA